LFSPKRIFVTGGAGFIGSAYIRKNTNKNNKILVLDKMTYASDEQSLKEALVTKNVELIKGDISDVEKNKRLINGFQPDLIVNFAAETHVDNSIHTPDNFIQTNIVGTYSLLQASYGYWEKLNAKKRRSFRFHHISTDEVYGDLPIPSSSNDINNNVKFKETTPYRPSSPYSASKAASDHLVMAWFKTYGFPVSISNCSNNYGPFQNDEKLIPNTIKNALLCNPIPIYGNGDNIRDWLYVDDHIDAINTITFKGQVGSSYNIGSSCELTNLEVVKIVLETLNKIIPIEKNKNNVRKIGSYLDFIRFVEDRPGHDRRYAIDPTKIENELGWRPLFNFQNGLNKTIRFYIEKYYGELF